MNLETVIGKTSDIIGNPFIQAIGKVLVTEKGTIINTPAPIKYIYQKYNKILVAHKFG